MPPFPRSEGLAGAAASLFSLVVTPCRRYFPGYRPRGHPYATAAADLGADAHGPRYATTEADPGAVALGPGGRSTAGRGGGVRKKQDHRLPAYPASGRGKPVGGHPPPWRAGARRPQKRDRGSHQNPAGPPRAQTPDGCRSNDFPRGPKPDGCPRVRGAPREPPRTQGAGKVCGTNARPLRDQVNCPPRGLDRPRAEVDGHQLRKRKHAPDCDNFFGEPGRYDVSRGPVRHDVSGEPGAGAHSSDRLSKRQRFAEEELNHLKKDKQGLSRSARRRMRRKAQKGQEKGKQVLSRSARRRMRRKAQKGRDPLSAMIKDLVQSTSDMEQLRKYHESFSIHVDKHRAVGPLIVPNENGPKSYWAYESKPGTSAMNHVSLAGNEQELGKAEYVPLPPGAYPGMALVSAADEWMQVEAANVAFNYNGDLPGSWPDECMPMETADVMSPASQGQGIGHPVLSAVNDKETAKDEFKLPAISAIEGCTSGEVADAAFSTSQDREPGKQDKYRFITAVGGRVRVDADVALPASPENEPAQPDLPAVAEDGKENNGKLRGFLSVGTLADAAGGVLPAPHEQDLHAMAEETMVQVENKLPGKLPCNAVVDELADETMAKVERKLPGHLKDLLEGRGSIPAHAGRKVGGSAEKLTSHDYATLRNGEWLNDEIINEYLSLIAKRGEDARFPRVHVFNIFFYKLLVDNGYDKVKRWTKKINIFEFDYAFVPIHLGNHWALGCMDMENKKITYYDSFRAPNKAALKALLAYIRNEAKTKTVDANGWRAEFAQKNPTQGNASDCGVFTCMAADYLSRRAELSFTQDQMPVFRRRMACALFYGKA